MNSRSREKWLLGTANSDAGHVTRLSQEKVHTRSTDRADTCIHKNISELVSHHDNAATVSDNDKKALTKGGEGWGVGGLQPWFVGQSEVMGNYDGAPEKYG